MTELRSSEIRLRKTAPDKNMRINYKSLMYCKLHHYDSGTPGRFGMCEYEGVRDREFGFHPCEEERVATGRQEWIHQGTVGTRRKGVPDHQTQEVRKDNEPRDARRIPEPQIQGGGEGMVQRDGNREP